MHHRHPGISSASLNLRHEPDKTANLWDGAAANLRPTFRLISHTGGFVAVVPKFELEAGADAKTAHTSKVRV